MKAFFDNLFTERIQGLHKAMDLASKRQQAIASNIANAETPHYRAVDVDFAGELERAFKIQEQSSIKKTNPKHMDIGGFGESRLIATLSGATKPDGNNVDIDIEMGRLNTNRSMYQNAAAMMRSTMSFLNLIARQS
jgi:flagellar basal-body rod protein FlgB